MYLLIRYRTSRFSSLVHLMFSWSTPLHSFEACHGRCLHDNICLRYRVIYTFLINIYSSKVLEKNKTKSNSDGRFILAKETILVMSKVQYIMYVKLLTASNPRHLVNKYVFLFIYIIT